MSTMVLICAQCGKAFGTTTPDPSPGKVWEYLAARHWKEAGHDGAPTGIAIPRGCRFSADEPDTAIRAAVAYYRGRCGRLELKLAEIHGALPLAAQAVCILRHLVGAGTLDETDEVRARAILEAWDRTGPTTSQAAEVGGDVLSAAGAY